MTPTGLLSFCSGWPPQDAFCKVSDLRFWRFWFCRPDFVDQRVKRDANRVGQVLWFCSGLPPPPYGFCRGFFGGHPQFSLQNQSPWPSGGNRRGDGLGGFWGIFKFSWCKFDQQFFKPGIMDLRVFHLRMHFGWLEFSSHKILVYSVYLSKMTHPEVPSFVGRYNQHHWVSIGYEIHILYWYVLKLGLQNSVVNDSIP